jgi:P4 family phage/plasmid primase-like protien
MILILTGVGSNGKSLLLNLVKEVMGDNYCRKMSLQFLLDQRTKSSGADPSIMDLERARLAHYSESNPDDKLNIAKIKEITGQEFISGRNLYEKQKNFRPTCHHVITTNHVFQLETNENGVWRRMRLYTFKHVFKTEPDPSNPFEKKEDPKLAMELSNNPAIKEACLSVLVEYYARLQNLYGGCLSNVPQPTIERETEDYRNSQDKINRFINDFIIVSNDSELAVSELVEAYKQWYINNIDNKEGKETNAELSKKLLNSKLVKYHKRTKTGICFKGLRTIESGLPDLEKNESYICKIKQDEFLKSL